MKHRDTMTYWEDMAHSNPSETTVKVNPQNDFTGLDAEFITNYTDRKSDVLDLASGTGLIVNKYHNMVGSVDAVELFPEFSRFITKAANVNIFNDDIASFSPKKDYDLILMFGIVQYFNEGEIFDIYNKYRKNLRPLGKLIVKNQFGVKDDVTVSGVSEELHRPYFSEYRHIEKEVRILKSIGFSAVGVHDIYPPEANRWENTHFYAIVAE